MAIQIEQRRVLRCQEGCTHSMRPGRGFEPDAHRCAIRTPEERFRPCLAGSHGRLPSSATIGGGEPASPIPVDECQPFAIEQELEPLARHRTKAGRRHVVAENRRDRDGVLAVGRKHVLDEHSATRSERQALDVIVLRRVLSGVYRRECRRLRIAEREPGDLLGGQDVSLDERRRNPKRAGNVVEPGGRIVRRQVLRRIDRQVEQIVHRIGVLGAVQTVKSRRRRVGSRGAIQLTLEPANQ